MSSRKISVYLLRYAVFGAVMYFSIQLALAWGVEEKSWFELAWDYIAGGSIGVIAGLVFFFAFGAVGWVSGALYGSIGLLSLMVGGGLGGLGLGAIVNVFRRPEKYNFDWLVISLVLLAGIMTAHLVSQIVGRFASEVASNEASGELD